MGLLDRVKQNQTVPPGSVGNGPATATLPGAPQYTPQTAVPVATQPAAPAAAAPPPGARARRGARPPPPAAPAPSLSQRAALAVGGEVSPAFTAAKVQI